MAAVSEKPWSQFSDSDFTDEQYRRSAVLDKGEGETAKQRYALPVREPDGMLSKAALSSAAGYLNATDASREAKEAARKKLLSLYKEADMDPPDSLQTPQSKQTAYQTPFAGGCVVELGNKLWRKRVLPYRTIEYDGGALEFTKDKAKRIAESFKKGAFEFVPFIVGDGHSNDTTKNGGRITGFDATDGGLDAIIQTNDEGERVINNHFGDLPVSVRFIEDYLRDSEKKHFGPTIQHVASTYMPRMAHMGSWKPETSTLAEVSDLSDSDPYEIVDLTARDFDDAVETPDAEKELSAEDEALIAEVESELEDEESEEADNGDESEVDDTDDNEEQEADMAKEGDKVSFKRGGETWSGEFKRMEGENAIVEVDGEEVKVPASMLKGGSSSSDDEKKEDKEMSAELSEYQGKVADLEAKLNRYAESDRRNTLELRRQKVERELEDYGRAGVPAADLDSARPLLMDDEASGELTYTDLSEDGASEKKSARGDLVRRMLDGRKGTVELGEKGDASAQLSEDDARMKKIKDYAKENELSFGEAARYVS